MQKITPFLWFDGKAEEAARYYVSVFKRAKIRQMVRYGDAGPGPKGSVMTVAFQIHGHDFVAINGGPQFTFTPAISFLISCKTQAEIDGYWRRLAKGGKPLQCGWIQDRYGVTWQIIPQALPKLITSTAAMQAMLGMVKIDLKRLQAAARRTAG